MTPRSTEVSVIGANTRRGMHVPRLSRSVDPRALAFTLPDCSQVSSAHTRTHGAAADGLKLRNLCSDSVTVRHHLVAACQFSAASAATMHAPIFLLVTLALLLGTQNYGQCTCSNVR